jgi:chaperonin cofactor prefoldin
VNDTVAIVGSHPKTRLDFDFTRTDCDIWVFNEALSNPAETWCPRADAVFQMHVETIWKNPNNRNDKNHAAWLAEQTDTIVYMQEQYPDVPMARKYPLDDVCGGLHFNKRYFTSSVAYALALAAHLGYRKVEVYGVEMETDTEYRYQRDGVTFWLGVALGRGAEVELHCGMMEAPLYGYEGDMKLDRSVFTDAIADAATRLPPLQEKYNEKRAATAELIRNFAATGKDGEKIVQAVQAQLSDGIQYGMLEGIKQECERYLKKADAMVEKTGDFLFSRQEFDSARQALQKKQAELMTKSNVLAGQTETAFREAEKIKNLQKRRKRVDDFVRTLDDYVKATVTTAMIVGALNKNLDLLAKMDVLLKAAGGVKSEAVLLEAYANRV